MVVPVYITSPGVGKYTGKVPGVFPTGKNELPF